MSMKALDRPDIGGGYQTGATVERASPPHFVFLSGDLDDVARRERQIILLLPAKSWRASTRTASDEPVGAAGTLDFEAYCCCSLAFSCSAVS